MKFLIVAQDLRVSGTSEGIVSRSFLSKLRVSYPDSQIDVVYLKQYESDGQLHLLPVDSIESHVLNLKVPFFTKFINRFYWRLFGVSLVVKHINKVYGFHMGNINYESYDHIFVRSSGVAHETILGLKGLPILKKAIINFHDPYPLFWYAGSKSKLTKMELFKLKEMIEVVSQAKVCMSSASLLSEDLQHLYGSRKEFFTLPHQYCSNVFDLSDKSEVRNKGKKVMISYHGAIQFGRDIEIVLEAYQELIEHNPIYKENTEFVIRVKGVDVDKLITKYSKISNIIILHTLNFSNSCYEQMHEADINIILENGPMYCNILVGKAPFLAALKKPILSISPERSEMRRIIQDTQYISSSTDKKEIKQKLENLIVNRMNSDEAVYPFRDYFSDDNFKLMLNTVLVESDKD